MIVIQPPASRRHATRLPALFLDRDGVINIDHGWVHRREDFVWMDGIFELAEWATDTGLPIVVVTNQGGIARGFYDEAAFQSLSRWMIAEFAKRKVAIDLVVGCPHHPSGMVGELSVPCSCRKPAPGMILHAAELLNLDLGNSIMVGDKDTDMAAAEAAGIPHRFLLARPEPGQHHSMTTLAEVLRHARSLAARWTPPPRG